MKDKMMKLWKNYNLSIVLLVLFLISWTAQFFMQLKQVSNEQASHGEPFQWAEFFPQFFTSTFENWQSEFLQLLTFVVLTSFLIHKNSHESRDTDDKFEEKLNKIIDLLENKNK